MFEMICAVLRDCAKKGAIPAYIEELSITPNMSLGDVGLDSLGRLTVFSELCVALELPQLDFDLQDDISLESLANHLLQTQVGHAKPDGFELQNLNLPMATNNGASYG